ncbi:MAG: segregation/condensation protein A [Cyanobacteria bacterium]|nr:segregation/condensation protein A [Cyanobacteriota bacterium]
MAAQPNHLPLTPYAPEEAFAKDGIELLVQMTKTGQLDPWNLDIVEVADRYLQAVADLRASDLKVTGKTLLYLAILLRLKSDQLAGRLFLNEVDPLEEAVFEDFDNGEGPDGFELEPGVKQRTLPYRSLDEVLRRRTSTKQPRIRPVTLHELILELKKYEALEKERNLRETVERADARRQMRDYSQLTSEDIESLAHEEFLEDTIFALKTLLEKVLNPGTEPLTVSLSDLVEQGGIDKVSAFLALLFLASRGEVDLTQERFYTELHVGLYTETADDQLDSEVE